MPLTTLMTWQADKRRWRKMYEGRLYHVSPSALGCPRTKEGSAAAANAWWRAKQAEIDGQKPPHRHASHLAEMGRRRDWAIRHGDDLDAEDFRREIERVEAGGEPTRGVDTGFPMDYFALMDDLSKFEEHHPLWEDRLSNDDPDPVPVDRTIGVQVGHYVALERHRVEAQLLSVREYDTIERCLRYFRDWCGAESSIDSINADLWEEYFLYLSALGHTREYKTKKFRFARMFIGYIASKGLISLPPNTHFRRFRFGRDDKAVETMTIGEVRRLVENAPGQLRLHLLLMVNCGMTQVDISDLKLSEINWSDGRVIRRRSKTKDNPKVPIVEYKLWPSTWELLQRYRQPDGEHALLTLSGRTWRVAELGEDGRPHMVDSIKSNYKHLMEKLSFRKPMKLLRKTSATLLNTHSEYRDLIGHFLGHVPRSVQERSYVGAFQGRFDEAVAWLGGQYGF